MGYRPRLLPARTPESRGPMVRACFGDADVIVDDVMRFLVPLRRHVPRAAWISIAMHPIGDELFMDWPHAGADGRDHLGLPAGGGLPPELEMVADKVVQTGPFLDLDGVPERDAARARVGFEPGAPVIVYAPRGFPFGKEFGHRMVAARLRRGRHAAPRAATHGCAWSCSPSAIRRSCARSRACRRSCRPGSRCSASRRQEDTLVYQRAADILVAEGTSTIHEGAALGTPAGGGARTDPRDPAAGRGDEEAPTPPTCSRSSGSRPRPWPKRSRRSWASRTSATPWSTAPWPMVAGGGGVAAAARLVLEVHARRRQRRA